MKINKILVIFISLIAGISILLWNGIQSDWVGSKFSEYVTQKLSSKLSAEVNFKSLDIKLFPPGIELNEVSYVDKIDKELIIKSEIVGLKFDLIKSMQKELTLDEIYIHNSKIRYTSPIKKAKSSDLNFKLSDINIENILKQINKKIPIRLNKLSFLNTSMVLDNEELNLNKLFLEPKQKEIDLLVDIDAVNKEFQGIKVKRIKFNGTLSDESILIDSLNVKNLKSQIEMKGIVSNYKKTETINFNIDYNVFGDIQYFNRYLELITKENIEKGNLKLDGYLKGSLKDFDSKNTLEINDFITPYVDGDRAIALVDLNENEIRVNKFILNKGFQELIVNKPFQFLNFKTNKFIEEPILAKLTKVKLNNGLKILKENLSVLDAEVSGSLKFVLNEKDYSFKLVDKVKFEKISLNISNNQIIDIPVLYSNNGIFKIFQDRFEMNLDINKDKTNLSINGSVMFDGPLKFTSKNGQIDLKDLGQISGIKYQGVGQTQINVYKYKSDSYMDINGKFDNFKIEKYSQDKVSANISLNFENMKMRIKDIVAFSGRTKSEADLEFNLKDQKINGTVEHSNIIFEEVVRSLNLADNMKNFAIQGDWSANYKLSGYLDAKKIVVDGEIKGKNNLFFDETFESISAQFKYSNQNLNIYNILFKRLNGTVEGSYQYSLITDTSNFSINPKQLTLEEFSFINKLPLGINGKLSGQISGVYKDSLDSLYSELVVIDSSIPGKKIGDSYLKMRLNQNIFDIELKLLGDKVVIDSKNYLKDLQNSRLNFVTTIDDINEVIGTNRLVNLEDTDISGQFFSKGFIEYNIKNLKIINSTVNIEKFSFYKDVIDFNYENPNQDEILVQDGKIKSWDFYLRGKNFYFISNAKGAFDKSFMLDADFKIDASIFEVLNKVVSKASGAIYGKYSLSDLKDLPNQKLKVKANGLSLSTSGYPLRFENINFLVNVDNKRIIIENLSSKLGAGNFIANGDVDFYNFVPKMNLDFKFTNAGITLFEKSNMIFSGSGSLKGSSFPYDLKSQFYIESFNLINEFTDLLSKSSSYSEDIKYLPNSQATSNQHLLTIKVDVKTLNPVYVKNSMADISFLSSLKISGSELSPSARGSVYLVPGINKVYFKGNDYDIIKSNIIFYNNRPISNPELDIEASSKIENYRLNAKVTGPAKNFNLNLRSDPFLEKSDILSLIAFGYTENTSTSLSEEQKSTMTQAGIGSLLFERFKINETLKKELGIQLNVGTEISSIENDYLSQRSGTGNSGQRVTSATKIGIKKEISSKVDLAVSSTIGSSVGQRQRMNLDYKVSDKVSLEGIYESRTDTQGVLQGTDSSLGMDVRIKWTFK